eukprot:TRINITY_DN6013_c0_g1_i1.p1 TRINITY_DN6013_c0_g1~~TRINITY_DN6013_c0_g1_i1.p1  ORF type:complete len:1190 (-),score=202.15 TRINITY_DN6013_c0_g1_i1:1691-5260(-)
MLHDEDTEGVDVDGVRACTAALFALAGVCSASPERNRQQREQLQDMQQAVAYLRCMMHRAESPASAKVVPSALLPARPALPVNDDTSGPGHLCVAGPRHDNDKADIVQIQVAPTRGEIAAARPPWLPRNDPRAFHHLEAGTCARHIDTQFRLTREDMVRPLIAGVQTLILARLDTLLERPGCRRLVRGVYSGAVLRAEGDGEASDIFVYRDVRLERACHGGGGFAIAVSFAQLPRLEAARKHERREFWERSSRRLQRGSIALLWAVYPVDAGGQPRLEPCTIVQRDPDELQEDRPRITVHPCSSVRDFAELFLSGTELILLTTNSGYFEAYGPVLEALKLLSHEGVPLDKCIVGGATAVEPPRYLREQKLDWSPLLSGATEQHLAGVGEAEFPLQYLQCNTSMDTSQLEALRACLTREMALVQGPPGTGKTYVGVQLMKLLIANRGVVPLPILCVCYTNHALDQFLCDLMANGITGLVRVGGRSKTPALDRCNLSEIVRAARGGVEFKHNRFLWHSATVQMEALETVMQSALSAAPTLDEEHPRFEDVSFVADEEFQEEFGCTVRDQDCDSNSDEDREDIENDEGGWTVVHNESPRAKWKRWLKGDTRPSRGTGPRYASALWQWPLDQRRRVVANWVREVREQKLCEFAAVARNYTAACTGRTEVEDDDRLRVLRGATVVGMTTTGAAKHQGLVRALSPRIIVCEEAGEVLEAHMLACLGGGAQHVVLIGDHLQLRPKCELYTLAADSGRGYNLDVSLFERLVMAGGGVPHATLRTQRRMLPAVADLARGTLYPQLEDPTCVAYPPVAGMPCSVWFCTHVELEDGASDGCRTEELHSHSNKHEARMAVGLARYLLQQGAYDRNEVTIITPYVGQLLALRTELKHCKTHVVVGERDEDDIAKYAGDQEAIAKEEQEEQPDAAAVTTAPLNGQVRLVSVDNFQGEESTTVILSLVRSNAQHRIGFLRSPNRTNVLLSRARHGLFIFGNAQCLRQSHDHMWNSVLDILEAKGAVSDYIPLRCARHPETEVKVHDPGDFGRLAYNGGCTQVCGFRLRCGHACERLCHPVIAEHDAYPCGKPCTRMANCGLHPCRRLCGERCGSCLEPVTVTLGCGHTQTVPCHEARHPASIKCQVKVKVHFAGCGHIAEITCHASRASDLRCEQHCGHMFECGHVCPKLCWECCTAATHGPCS